MGQWHSEINLYRRRKGKRYIARPSINRAMLSLAKMIIVTLSAAKDMDAVPRDARNQGEDAITILAVCIGRRTSENYKRN